MAPPLIQPSHRGWRGSRVYQKIFPPKSGRRRLRDTWSKRPVSLCADLSAGSVITLHLCVKAAHDEDEQVVGADLFDRFPQELVSDGRNFVREDRHIDAT